MILNEEIPDLWQKFSTLVSKTKSMRPEEKFDIIFFGRRYNFIFCVGFSEETQLCMKTAYSSVRHSSRPVEHSKGQNSRRNKTFLTFGHWARIFGFLARQNWQSCQNCNPCDQSSFWNKLNFFSKNIALLILLQTSSDKFQYSLKTDPPALSSLHTSRLQKLQKKNWTNQAGILRVRRSLTIRGKNLAVNKTFWLMGKERKNAGLLAKGL